MADTFEMTDSPTGGQESRGGRPETIRLTLTAPALARLLEGDPELCLRLTGASVEELGRRHAARFCDGIRDHLETLLPDLRSLVKREVDEVVRELVKTDQLKQIVESEVREAVARVCVREGTELAEVVGLRDLVKQKAAAYIQSMIESVVRTLAKSQSKAAEEALSKVTIE